MKIPLMANPLLFFYVANQILSYTSVVEILAKCFVQEHLRANQTVPVGQSPSALLPSEEKNAHVIT